MENITLVLESNQHSTTPTNVELEPTIAPKNVE